MMSSYNLRRREGVGGFDLLLIVGLALAPMTELRIWKVGPAELLCAVWCARYLRYYFDGGVNRPLAAFWLPFYLTLTAGTLFCLQFYPSESSGLGGLVTWFFMMFLSLGVYAGLMRRGAGDILRILETTCFVAAVWYIFLLVYSRVVSPTFFGARLWYARVRFTGGGANPHQMAILALGLMFVSFYFLVRVEMPRARRAAHAVSAAAFFYILFLTRSATAWMAMLACAALGAALLVVRGAKAARANRVAVAAAWTLGALGFILGFVWLFDRFMAWVSADPNGMGRFELFSYIVDPLRKNFLFGLGDGTHSNGGISEFHNTYLEIIGMTGLVGVIIFAVFTVRIFLSLRRDPYLLLVPLALYIYGLAGFGMRRLPYWALTSFMLALAQKLPRKEESGPPAPARGEAPRLGPGGAA